MTHLLLQTFSITLNEMMERTIDKMRATVEDLAGCEALPPDVADRASMESDRNFALLMRERDRQALVCIREALSRIAAGEYGECEECGDEIALARLKAQPTATLCVYCQSRRENVERLRASDASVFFQA